MKTTFAACAVLALCCACGHPSSEKETGASTGMTSSGTSRGSSSTSGGTTTGSGSSGSAGSTTGSAVVCPGAGDFCGSDGVRNGAITVLYHCAAAGSAPTGYDFCASTCDTHTTGPDTCRGGATTTSTSSASSTGSSGTTGALVCPGAGAYCGDDGVTHGAPSTLYSCPGAGAAPSSSTVCATGCNVQPAGTNDLCNGGTPVCPGRGPYCGKDGVTNGAAETLYECPGQGQPPSTSTPCASGCSVQPSGTADFCTGNAIVCPGHGAYCGKDGVAGGSPDTLYQCPGQGLAPGSSTPCATGCSVQPSGTSDLCNGTTPVCSGRGAYCGSDGVQNGDAHTLYECPGANQAPTSAQSCASGCSVQPPGVPDSCAGSTPVCPGAGAYCGGDGVTNGNPSTLYQCPGAGSAPSSATPCSNGCSVQPAGTNDSCKLSCPGTGDYCGSDGVSGGDASTLYQCPGAGQAPSSATPCSAGCHVNPAGTNDVCNGSCGGAMGNALAFQAAKIAQGRGGACNGSPPGCYSEWCLGFVNDALSYAGLPAMYAPSAADAMNNQINRGNFVYWNGSCPCGKILFWAGNSCNAGWGHVVICNGDGTVSTSGWSNYGGSTHASISWLIGQECGRAPAGYASP
jgi:hypothetical protein